MFDIFGFIGEYDQEQQFTCQFTLADVLNNSQNSIFIPIQ
jgi:hypothetical protein